MQRQVKIEKVSGLENPADLLTKGLPRRTLEYMIKQAGLTDVSTVAAAMSLTTTARTSSSSAELGRALVDQSS
jgi:hypothetical protein